MLNDENKIYTKRGFINYNTPNIINYKQKYINDNEMRKTCKLKPPLIFSKLPAAFEINNLISGNRQNMIMIKPYDHNPKLDKNYLEPIRKSLISNIRIIPTRRNNKTRGKLQLKPIEIKDPRISLNKNIGQAKEIKANVEVNMNSLEKLSKTSQFYFKSLENEDNINEKIEPLTNLSVMNIKIIEDQASVEEYEELIPLTKMSPNNTVRKLLHIPSLKVLSSVVMNMIKI